MARLHRNTVRSVYDRLLAAYGPQHWWPADTSFEVLVGAVLTQNAAWTNVEYALGHLRDADALDSEAILALDDGRLGALIRPSGYFNVKARRLKALCRHVVDAGGLDALAAKDTPALRRDLLAVNGIGRETADDIVLYAFHRPVFVIDAYTRRIFARLGKIDGNEGYEDLRQSFERAVGPDVDTCQEYHGLLVEHAKQACNVRPRCSECALRRRCPVGRGEHAVHS
ncbi:MAG: endonuclease [Halofilum sp. (in: g-proteobacteria)]|nr:endonuclease [Halofilum sp. (in: g-proteobacteria)]